MVKSIAIKDSEVMHEAPEKIEEYIRNKLKEAGAKNLISVVRDNVNSTTVFSWDDEEEATDL